MCCKGSCQAGMLLLVTKPGWECHHLNGGRTFFGVSASTLSCSILSVVNIVRASFSRVILDSFCQ